jgi:predicted SprT family Zn-dependent metalloprotease
MKANEIEYEIAVNWLMEKFPEIQTREYFITWGMPDVISFYKKIKKYVHPYCVHPYYALKTIDINVIGEMYECTICGEKLSK